MTTTEHNQTGQNLTGERADLIEALTKHRNFLRYTAQGLTDEQANITAAASTLTIGGLIKHVAEVESAWAHFASTGKHPASDSWSGDGDGGFTPEMIEKWQNEFRLADGQTLQAQLDRYA